MGELYLLQSKMRKDTGLSQPGKVTIFGHTQGNSGKLGKFEKIGRSQGNSGNNYLVRKINLILHILTCIHVFSGLNIVRTSKGRT